MRLVVGIVCLGVTASLAAAVDLPTEQFVARWGGSGKSGAGAIAADGRGRVYIVGFTSSPDFPATTGKQSGRDVCAFTTALDAALGAEHFSALTCGAGTTWGRDVAISAAGEPWVAGVTRGGGFSTTADAAQPRYGGSARRNGAGDAFLVRWGRDGRALRYATYLGGASVDVARDVAVDAEGQTWVTGLTDSRDFPLTASSEAGAAVKCCRQAFVGELDVGAGTVAHAQLVGTEKYPRTAFNDGNSIAVTADAVFVAGATAGRATASPAAYGLGGGGQIVPTPGALGAGQRFTSMNPFVVALQRPR